MYISTYSEFYSYLLQFCVLHAVTSVPSLKDLYNHITPQYAADWRVIGTLLGFPSGALEIIENGNTYV